MNKDEFLDLAEENKIHIRLWRHKRMNWLVAQGFFHGHNFLYYDAYKQKVIETPNWGERHSTFWKEVELVPYGSSSIDTQAR